MITETKRQVSQMVEINRALTQDLDISHRNAAEFARERDALVENIEKMRHELDILLRDSDASRTRAHRAENQLSILAVQLQETEEERDDIKLQFDESASAMEEIRSRLVNLPNEAVRMFSE